MAGEVQVLAVGGVPTARIAEKFDISAQRVGQLFKAHDPRRRSPVLGQVSLHPRQMFTAAEHLDQLPEGARMDLLRALQAQEEGAVA